MDKVPTINGRTTPVQLLRISYVSIEGLHFPLWPWRRNYISVLWCTLHPGLWSESMHTQYTLVTQPQPDFII